MKNYHSLYVLFVSFLVSAVHADTFVRTDYTLVGTFSIGPVWHGNGERQTFFLAPQLEKTYTAGNSTNHLIDAELFLGMQKCLCNSFAGQLGLALATTGDARLSGEIWDDANPQFNNSNYHYKINHSHIALKGKLLADIGDYCISPWVSVSMGIGLNKAYAFSNTPIIFAAVANANFPSQTITTFTYTVGAGIQRAIANHWQLGIGYEFADWGESELGRAQGQTLNDGLRLHHLYTNGVMFNITYLA